MLKNLIKIAFRSLVKDRAYSGINILGLTIGITCSLFLAMYIIDELSFDRYHKNGANIYRIESDIKEPDNAFTWISTQKPLGRELRDNYPEVVNAVRFDGMNRNLYKNGDLQFYENGFYLADSTAFDMFTYEFIAGDPATALDAPFSLVLTEIIAKKYFSDPADALGQSLQNQQGEEFKITAVMRDVPLNSHFRFDGLVSQSTRPQFQGGWGGFSTITYVQLPAGYDLSKMYASLDKILKEKVQTIFDEYGIKVQYRLQPILDIHLYSKVADGTGASGDISYVYTFAAVAAFMIIVACINYMNLATARSTKRAKEVGLRKVMGSQRSQLIAQFLTESVIVTLIAVVISIVLIYAFLPVFNTIANKQLPFDYVLQPYVLVALLGVVVITGIVGGSYPAFYLASFSPVSVLKGKLSGKGGNAVFRKFLVVLQFALSIFMLISTLVVYDQLQFLRNTDLGFDKENVMKLNLNTRELQAKSEVFSEVLRKLPGVVSVGRANSAPGEGVGKNIFQVEDAQGKLVDRGVDVYGADFDYIDALDMEVVEGRNFSRSNPSDTTYAVIVNESMVTRMGWTDPIGRKFVTGQNNEIEKRVVGVVKDYNHNSLYDAIEPLIILLDNERTNYVFVRVAAGDPRERVATVENQWKATFPGVPFEFAFLDEDLQSQYTADQKRSSIFTAFSGLTVVIACLGLLGLAAYTTEQRTKEIGVRKVIGASVNSLVMLVSREFFVLVGVGTIIGYPVAWYFTDRWLQNFAYRINLTDEWPTFVLSALLALVITMMTVGFHVVRSATSNPVKALRDE
jgi:putative ABC transport system permease protein